MCGIVGYIGQRKAQPILIEGLKKLEYRGYDSAGVAIYDGKQIEVRKTKGRITDLEQFISTSPLQGSVGIGHTRWATHGRPSDVNSHPHTDESGKITVVHNGIIENYQELKETLQAKGIRFKSETDTEVIGHLIAELYDGDLARTIQKVVTLMRGAYALAVISEHEPNKIVVVRLASPLIIGVGQGENFIGSDIPALLEHTREIYILEDGDMAVITKDHVDVRKVDTNEPVNREIIKVNWDLQQAEKGGFEHFMLKEIFEQPVALRKTMLGYIDDCNLKVDIDDLQISAETVKHIEKIRIVACGTAYHAGLIGKYVMEELTRIPVEVDVASEFRYRRPIITDKTLVIVVSQSGETADTLSALRESKRLGAKVLAITNVIGSSIARDSDYVFATMAGPEIAVASTKAYSTQLLAFYLLGIYFAQLKETINPYLRMAMIGALTELPNQVEMILEQSEQYRVFAQSLAKQSNVFFIGRGVDYAVALEGSLKLKEISYIHSEAYAAGELKHGTLALIEDGTRVISLTTQEEVIEKMVSNIKEVKARGAYVYNIGLEASPQLRHSVDESCNIPNTLSLFTPILSVVPLQLIAYYTSVAKGNDVDKPRNLAKSVTVE